MKEVRMGRLNHLSAKSGLC